LAELCDRTLRTGTLLLKSRPAAKQVNSEAPGTHTGMPRPHRLVGARGEALDEHHVLIAFASSRDVAVDRRNSRPEL